MIISMAKDSDGDLTMITSPDLSGVKPLADAFAVSASVTLVGEGGIKADVVRDGADGDVTDVDVRLRHVKR